MIYYSHINEDNRVERSLFIEEKFSMLVAVCGSGERVLSLLDNTACKSIVVVDSNEEALFLLQLKIAALTRLSVNEYLGFIGQHDLDGNTRVELFKNFKTALPAQAFSYWNERRKFIRKGILNIGHFERFLQRVRPLTKLWLGRSFQRIFRGEQQSRFPTRRWNLLRELFSMKIVYRLAGNHDEAFTDSHAETGRIPGALDQALKSGRASSSFMAHLIFRGDLSGMKKDELPPSLQLATLAAIKERLMQNDVSIRYHAIDLLEFVTNTPRSAQPVFYSLSDILSFADFNYLMLVIERIAGHGACITGRSFLRNRVTEKQFKELGQFGSVSLHDEQDSTGMYQVFSIQSP